MRDTCESEKAIRKKLEPITSGVWPGSHLEVKVSTGGETAKVWIVAGGSPLGNTLAEAADVVVSGLLEKDATALRAWLAKISI